MHELLHSIGLCPENLAFGNTFHIFILYYQQIILYINKGYEATKNLF